MTTDTACPTCHAALPPRATAGLCPRCLFTALAGAPEGDSTPARLGEYDLLEPLGQGGMGTVWRARQRSAKRDVALKTIIARGADAERRFRAEIEAAARLEHPNIVPVYEVGEADGHLWFTMRLLAGGTLAGKKMPARDAAALVAKLARAISSAHERGVLHRDLKPANVLLDEAGEPFIADFGLARLLDVGASLSVSGAVVGTPQYMAPEQASGGHATTATDGYGLGAILYELLSGRAPFEGKSTVEVLRKVSEDEPRKISDRSDGSDRCDVETIALKCLSKNPARRYASAAALADDLERWLRGEPILARPATRVERLRAWARRNRALAASLAVAVAALCIFTFLQWRHGLALRTERDTARGERDSANTARARAERSEAALAENLYAADMQLAWRAYDARDLGEAMRILDLLRSEHPPFEHRLLAALCEGGQEKMFSHLGKAPYALTWLEKTGRIRVGGAGWIFDLDPAAGETKPVYRGFFPLFDERSARPAAARLFPIEPWPTGFGEVPDAFLQRVNPGPTGNVMTLASSADGRLLATSDRIRWSRVWDTASGEYLGAAPLSHGTVSMDAAGRFLAVGARRHTDADRGTAVLDLATRREPWLLPEAGGAAAISRDGARLFTGSHKNVIRVWDVASRREIRAWPVAQWTSALAISNDGRRAACALAFDRTITVLNVDSGAVVREMRGQTGRIHSLAFSPDGAQLASASADRTARLWSLTGGADHELRGHRSEVTGVAWSPEGAQVATASPDGSVRLWSRDGPRTVPEVVAPWMEAARTLVFINGPKRLIATGRWESNVEIFNFRTGEMQELPNFTGSAEGWDGDLLVVCPATHDALEWREPGGKLHRRLALENAPRGRPVARRLGAGAQALASVAADRRLRVWRDGALKFESAPLDGTAVALGLTRDGGTVVAACYDGRTRTFDTASGAVLWETPGSQPRFVDISPDGTLAAIANAVPDEIHIRDTATGQLRARLTGHTDNVWAAVFSPDGRTIASIGHDQTARLWHVGTGRQLAILVPDRATMHLAFSSDGEWLLVGTAGNKAITWRVK